LFFAGAGGMLGVASNAGRGWSSSAIILFLIMAVLTFIQRAVTGMYTLHGYKLRFSIACIAGLKPPAQYMEALRAGTTSRFQPTFTN
jgi:hypothetical protein